MGNDSSGKEATLSMWSMRVRLPYYSPNNSTQTVTLKSRMRCEWVKMCCIAAIAQMVERLPCKQDVPSSILGGGTKL